MFPGRSTAYANLDPTVTYFTSYHFWLVILALLTQVVLVLPSVTLLVLSPCMVGTLVQLASFETCIR